LPLLRAGGTQERIKRTLASARISRVRWIGALVFCLLASSRAQTNQYAYEIGEIAREDICTPVQLLVIDPRRTEDLRKSETPRLPAYFRFNTNAVDGPQARLLAAFATIRELFQSELRSEYGKKTLTQPETREQRFLDFRSAFETRHKSFPLTLEVAQQWAMGRAGSAVLFSWDSKLRQTMALYIRPNNLPAEASYSPQVRILTNTPAADPVDLAIAEEQSVLVARNNLLTVAQARQNLARRFPANQQTVAAFIGELLVENCAYDRKLTELSRAPRLAALWEGDRYTPGHVIAHAGQPIDARIKAALDEMAAAIPPPAPAPAPVQQIVIAPAKPAPPYLFYGSGVLLVLCLICVAVSWRFLFAARKTNALIPFPSGTGERPGLSAPDQDWLDRALIAEHRAREVAASARSALVPKFMQWLKSQGVQNLIAQREELLGTQKLAELELARLEQMLTELHLPIGERIKAYEQRIADLEQALKAKGEESHELIETMIRLTRQKLEAERQATPGMTWN
jgi:7TM-HD extracellular protein